MQAARLTDDLIGELSGRLSSDWYKLGIELDLDMKIINRINDRSRVHAERWPLTMLQEWRKKKQRSRHDQLVELVQALDKIHRNDLVAVVRHHMEAAGQQEISDRLLMQVAEGVNIEWYNLGIQLNIPTDKMDVIKMEVAPDQRLEPGVAMLRAFRDYYSGGDIIRDLKKALREIRRLDLSRYIDENLPSCQSEPHSAPLHGSPRHGPPLQGSPRHGPPQAAPSMPSSQRNPHLSPLHGSPQHGQPKAAPSKSKSSAFPPERSSFHTLQERHFSSSDDDLSCGPTFTPQSSLNTGILSPTSGVSPSSSGPSYLLHQSGSSSIVTSGASFTTKKS